MTSALHRPEPLAPGTPARIVDRHVSPEAAVDALLGGTSLRIEDHFCTGVRILEALDGRLPRPAAESPFGVRRARDRRWREAALHLLTPIVERRVALGGVGSDTIGFAEELYPEAGRFLLPFVQVQELHGAWRRYVEGVHLGVLGHRLHPFFGTYVPTRMSHLELFATWLSGYTGNRTRAVDVGTGCGVLAFLLARAGFDAVLATDCNPNAVESVRRDLTRRPAPPPVDVREADLLGEDATTAELIVFNPPWTRGPVEGYVDEALHFDDDLFDRFFDEALARVGVDGRVVLIFSNVIQLVQPDIPHPILNELERGRFRLVDKLQRRVKPPRGRGRRRTKERVEVWELAPA